MPHNASSCSKISPFEFWVLLPAKTMISRSKVNTHQLVAYTDELFVKVGEIEKNVAENMNISSEHFKNLLAKSEAQEAQIDKLMKIVQIQAEQLERINEVLFEIDDGGNNFNKGTYLKTESVETLIQLLIEKGVNNDAKKNPFGASK